MKRTVESPDSKQSVHFEYEGEIPFGPPYFTLALTGHRIANRSFGDEAVWSGDSRYVAVQEWLSTSKATGPQTALLCIDTTERKQCRVSTASHGFIVPIAFDGARLIYKKRYVERQGERTAEYEIEFADLPRWEALDLAP